MKESTLTSGDNDQKTQKYILYYKLYASDARKWIARSDRYVRTAHYIHTQREFRKISGQRAVRTRFSVALQIILVRERERYIWLAGWTMEWMDGRFASAHYIWCAFVSERECEIERPLVTQYTHTHTLCLSLACSLPVSYSNLSVCFVGILNIAPETGL